jgi:outer membrane protein assembly factor BamB
LPPGSWEAPPVRNSAMLSASSSPVPETTARRKRRSLALMAGVVGFVIVALAGLGAFVWFRVINSENRLAQEAREDYDQGLFGKAEEEYRELLKRFSESEHCDEYLFMAELSELRKLPTALNVEPKSAFEKIASFLRKYGKHPLMNDHLSVIGETYMKLVKDVVVAKAGPNPERVVEDWLVAAENALAEMRGEIAPAVTPPKRAEVAADFTRIRADIARAEQRRAILAQLHALPPTIPGIREADRLIRENGLINDSEAKGILQELYDKHPQSIRYVTTQAELKAGNGQGEDPDRSILVDPKLQGSASAFVEDESIVLALVRGVLYALRQGDGAVQWAMRVGIDTTTLPVHVPQTAFSPELILVQSADTSTLTALDRGGRQVWQYHLSAPALGRPIVIKDRTRSRAFVPTFDGQIHEIELARGLLLGRYTLGEGVKLSVGGVHQPGSNRIYFPGDEWCVYVIDVDTHKCETILYTKHHSGSLRGEPVLASWTEPGENRQVIHRGYLFLGVTEDLNSMRIRAYPLPIEDPRAPPLPMNPDPRVRGWSWFPPYQDAEKIVQVTDDGMLGLFGIKQKRNEDNPLFLLVPPDPKQKGGFGYNLNDLLKPKTNLRGRSLIAYVEEPDNFWVLAHGELQRLQLLMTLKQGPMVRAVWPKAVPLGLPLHESQTFAYPFEIGAEPPTSILLVTQPLTQQTALATAVDAATGRIRWQRQLGIVCRGEPLKVGGHVLALDQGGGVFAFDIEKFSAADAQWPVGTRSLAPALDDGQTPPILLPGPDGKSAYEFAIPDTPEDTNSKLIVRVFRDEGGPTPTLKQPEPIDLKARLTFGGKPAISSSGILVPLSDGQIWRFDLNGKPSDAALRPNWQFGRAEPDQSLRTHVVWLNAEEFLTTDGGSYINRWRWKAGTNELRAVPPHTEETEPTIPMPASVATAPLPLPLPQGRDGVRAVVACGDNILYLVEGRPADAVKTDEEGLKIVGKPWNPRGKITGGPFLLDGDFLVIVDRNRLVRFSPDKAEKVWEYTSEGEAIVGQPQLIDGMLVAADQSGRYVGLNPKTGKPHRKEGYRLHASAGPAASPITFGPGQAFAPLTDGTVLLLDLKHLREK